MSRPAEWILASGSPRRQELLKRLRENFLVIHPSVEEWDTGEADPEHLVEENSRRKGRAVAAHHQDSLVISADTTVALGQRIFAKPANGNVAMRMLAELSGMEHRVLTGVSLFFREQEHHFHEASTVRFKQLDQQAIARYLSLVHVLDKAGAYAIQEHRELIIDEFSGSFENIMGLPVQRLRSELVQLGWW